VPVENRFFGGNVAVTGLMVGEDLARALADEPAGHRYLLPDVCLSGGLFLDGTKPEDLPRPVEIIRSDGISLRQALSL
jgi:NifB/MoaA-like Fe-S oxidoreductase